MMEYSETLGYRLTDTNPCAGLRRKKIGFSGSCPSDQDYKAIDRALAGVAESNPDVTILLLIVVLTGARREEIENLKWSEINDDVAVLQHSKTGTKTIQLPAEVRILLQGVPRRAGDPYVFGPGSRPAVRARLTKLWAFIRQSIGRPDLRIHDLRHGYGTKGLELGESLHTMSKLLGHTDIETTMGYSHPSWQMLVSAAHRVSANMERRLNTRKDQRAQRECGWHVAGVEAAPLTWPTEVTIDHFMMPHIRAYRNQSEDLATFCTAQKIDPVQLRNALRLFQNRRRILHRIACKEKARSQI